MEILCACPFVVAALGWEPAPGRRSLSLCVKATFTLAPGAATSIAALQEPIVADTGATMAVVPDLVPFKPRVDILVTGHAYAPGGAPTDSLIARARVGSVRKSLSINGDRTWVPSFDGLRPSIAVPFRRMPLVYERAVRTGENLTGVDISQGAEPNRPLANIAAIADQGGETPGLAPLPLVWRARRHGLGDAALLWASRAGLAPGSPPPGFDFRVFNAAPAEQQIDELPLGPEILLENLHPEHARIETRLPPLRVKVFRRAPRADQSVEVQMRCDTLWIDTDRGLAFTLWRGAIAVENGDDASVGQLVVTAEAEDERIGPPEVDRLLARFAPEVVYVSRGVARGDRESYPPLPEPLPIDVAQGAPPARLPTPLVPPPARMPTPVVPPRMPTPVVPRVADLPPVRVPAPLPLPVAPFPMSQPAVAPAGQLGFLAQQDGYPPPPPQAALTMGPQAAPNPAPPAAALDETIDTPTPRPVEVRRSSTTLVPPAPAAPEASGLHALPFRPAPAAETAPLTMGPQAAPNPAPPAAAPRQLPFSGGALPAAWAAPESDDEELTPPRGKPSLPDAAEIGEPVRAGDSAPPSSLPTTAQPEAAAAPAPPAAAPVTRESYASAKVEAWRTGEPLAAVLARRGIDEAAFAAHDAAQLDAVAREAAEGKSALASSLLADLDAARAAQEPREP